jgi:hypothetical protein
MSKKKKKQFSFGDEQDQVSNIFGETINEITEGDIPFVELDIEEPIVEEVDFTKAVMPVVTPKTIEVIDQIEKIIRNCYQKNILGRYEQIQCVNDAGIFFDNRSNVMLYTPNKGIFKFRYKGITRLIDI